WHSWGIEPAAVIGHSVGEVTAACVAGVFSLEDALTLIVSRSRLMGSLPCTGDMVSVFTAEGRVARYLAQHRGDVAIAAVNAPENVVISGRREAVAAIVAALDGEGVETRALNVSHAFHSPLMEPILDEFEESIARIVFRRPRLKLVSNVTGCVV